VPVILVTNEAEIKKDAVLGQPKQVVGETPSQQIAGCGSARLSSLWEQEV
jgi:hypothetical protein